MHHLQTVQLADMNAQPRSMMAKRRVSNENENQLVRRATKRLQDECTEQTPQSDQKTREAACIERWVVTPLYSAKMEKEPDPTTYHP